MAGVILAHAVEIMARPWRWGEADCCTAACDVFARLHGVDPMAPLRGRYGDRQGAFRLIKGLGGWVPMATSLAASAGLRAGRGEAGEIGVAALPDGGHALVVCVAPGSWAGKTLCGLATVAQVERCWRA